MRFSNTREEEYYEVMGYDLARAGWSAEEITRYNLSLGRSQKQSGLVNMGFRKYQELYAKQSSG